MIDILFVTPVFTKTAKHESIGTLLLATILKQNSINADIYRYYEADTNQDFNSFVEQTVSNILSRKAKIVSFYCRIDCFLANVIVAKKLKEINPEIIIIFGGPQADVTAKETLEQFHWVDYCCIGEGETIIYPLVSSLLDGKDISFVKGLTYRNSEGIVVSNATPDLVKDLDTLPYIDYKSLIPQELLSTATGLPLEVGRGCPFNCAYCSTSLFWQRRFRLKSPERIIAEIKELNTNYGICSFGFQHDLFTANKKLVSAFCKALKESNLKIRWSCSSRSDTIDEEIIKEMAASNLNAIFLGIETGSPRMQELIHKKLDIEKTVSVVQHLLNNNIIVRASFMFGFPEETYDDVEKTLQLIYRLKQMGVQSIQLHLCSITPGTEYFKRYKDELVWAESTSNHTGDFGLKENEDFVHAHKDIFSYFLELRSELRTRLSGLDTFLHILLELYDIMRLFDPNRAIKLRLVDIALGLRDSNAEQLKESITFDFCNKHKYELFLNYLSTLYDANEVDLFKEYFLFKKDLADFQADDNLSADVKSYNINISDVGKRESISKIEKNPCLVYFKKVNGKTSYVVRPMM